MHGVVRSLVLQVQLEAEIGLDIDVPSSPCPNPNPTGQTNKGDLNFFAKLNISPALGDFAFTDAIVLGYDIKNGFIVSIMGYNVVTAKGGVGQFGDDLGKTLEDDVSAYQTWKHTGKDYQGRCHTQMSSFDASSKGVGETA